MLLTKPPKIIFTNKYDEIAGKSAGNTLIKANPIQKDRHISH